MDERGRVRVWPFLTAAVLAAAGLAAVYAFFVRGFTGQIIDERAKLGAQDVAPGVAQYADRFLDPLPLACLTLGVLIVIVIGVARRRPALTLLALGVIVAANVTTQVLKHLVLTRPDIGATWTFGNSLPSGHTTVIASVGFAAVIVASPRMRPLAAVLGSAATVLTGVLLMLSQWHRPSDVIAGILVVALWGSLAGAVAAATGRVRAARTTPHGRGMWWAALVLGAVSLVAIAPVVATIHEPGAHLLPAALAGLTAIAAAGCANAAALTGLFRRVA